MGAKIVLERNVPSGDAASISLADRAAGAILVAFTANKKTTVHRNQAIAEASANHLEALIERDQ